jgi:hypothetical protein
MIPLAMTLMAAGAYKQHKRDKLDAQRDQEDRDELMAERKQKRADRERTTAAREAVANAYAPVETSQEQLAGPTMPDEPAMPVAAKAGTKFYGTMGEASDAAAAANDPMAQADRASRALLAMGEVAPAQAIRTSARQEKLGGLQLDEAQRKMLAQAFDDSLQPLATHDAIAETISSSNLGGALKVKAVPGADGKTVEYHVVEADGSTKPSGYSFENSPRGLLEAKAAMSKLTPVSQKLEYLHKQDTLRRQTERDAADARFKQAEFDQRQPLVDSQVAENNARSAYFQGGGAQGGRAPAPERMAEPDKIALEGLQRERTNVEKRIGQIEDAILKSQADGMWDEAAPNAMAMRQQLRQQQERIGALRIQEGAILRKYQQTSAAPDPYGLRGAPGGAGGGGAPAGGQPVVPAATQAARDVEAGQQMVLSQFGGDVNRARAELAQMLDGIRRAPAGEARSMLQRQAAQLQAGIEAMSKAPAAAGPGEQPGQPQAAALAPPGAAGAPGAVAQRPAAAIPAAVRSPVVAPAQPLAGMASLNSTAEDKAILQVLKARIAAAARGGQPLNEAEMLRAKQAGLI